MTRGAALWNDAIGCSPSPRGVRRDPRDRVSELFSRASPCPTVPLSPRLLKRHTNLQQGHSSLAVRVHVTVRLGQSPSRAERRPLGCTRAPGQFVGRSGTGRSNTWTAPRTMPAQHSYRPRPPRFILTGDASSNPRTAAGLNHLLSASGRESRASALRQTQAEFSAFLSALDTVESAGRGGLSQLPRERLLEIQAILRNGGGMLQPIPTPPGSASTLLAMDAAAPAPATPVSQGLKPDELVQLQTFVLQHEVVDADACAVCLCDMLHGEKCTVLACGHRYHHACVLRWLELSKVCPLCKAHALNGPACGACSPTSNGGSSTPAAAEEQDVAGQWLMVNAANAIAASRAATTAHRTETSGMSATIGAVAASRADSYAHRHEVLTSALTSATSLSDALTAAASAQAAGGAPSRAPLAARVDASTGLVRRIHLSQPPPRPAALSFVHRPMGRSGIGPAAAAAVPLAPPAALVVAPASAHAIRGQRDGLVLRPRAPR